MRGLILSSAALSALSFVAGSASAAIVYSNNFEGAVGSEWSSTITDVTPVGARGFLGQFDNALVTLSLPSLPAHDTVTVSFSVYFIQSWDGNNSAFGPDRWGMGWANNVQGSGGTALLDSTFSQFPDANFPQSYPAAFGSGINNPAGTGAAETGTLGYSYPASFGDSVYNFSFSFPHTDSAIYFGFIAQGLQGIGDESWGLDNVQVEVSGVPAPGAAATLGMVGLVALRRRR